MDYINYLGKNKTTIRKLPRYIIYVLYSGDEVIYVGQSTKGVTRFLEHLNKHTCKITHYSFIVVNKKDLNNIESHCIVKLQPKENTILPSNNYYYKFNFIARKYKVPRSNRMKLYNQLKEMYVFRDYLEDNDLIRHICLSFKPIHNTCLESINISNKICELS